MGLFMRVSKIFIVPLALSALVSCGSDDSSGGSDNAAVAPTPPPVAALVFDGEHAVNIANRVAYELSGICSGGVELNVSVGSNAVPCDDGNGGSIGTVTCAADDTWSCSFSSDLVATDDTRKHVRVVVESDDESVINSLEWNLPIDLAAPKVTLDTSAIPVVNLINQAAFELNGTCNEPGKVSLVAQEKSTERLNKNSLSLVRTALAPEIEALAEEVPAEVPAADNTAEETLPAPAPEPPPAPTFAFNADCTVAEGESVGKWTAAMDLSQVSGGEQNTAITVAINFSDIAGNPAIALTRELTRDLSAPKVTAAVAPADGEYRTAGKALIFTLTFDQDVTVQGIPYLELSVDPSLEVQKAMYEPAGSTATELKFSYPVGDLLADSDGIEFASTDIVLGKDGSIRDEGGNNVELSFDDVAPSLAGITVNTDWPRTIMAHDGPVVENASFYISISFTKDVEDFELADIEVTNGAASEFSAVGESKADYSVLITPDNDDVTLVTVAVAENKVTDADGSQNEAAVFMEIVTDLILPGIASVAKDGTSNDYFKSGASVILEVTFSEAVTVVGAPLLSLVVGGNREAVAVYVPAVPSVESLTHNFRYTVGSENDYDGIEIASISIPRGSSILDKGSNAIIRRYSQVVSDVKVDNHAPMVAGLADDSVPTQDKTWEWECADNQSGSTCLYRAEILDSASGTISSPNWVSTEEMSSTNGADGTKYLHVQAKDEAGNESAVVVVSAVLDNTAPAKPLNIAFAAGQRSPGNDTTPTIEVVGDNGDSIELFTDSTCSTSVGLALVNAGKASITSSAITQSGTFYARATDSAGNFSICSTEGLAYALDIVAPTVSSATAGAADSKKQDDDIDVVVTFSEAVRVIGHPSLILDIGGRERVANYQSGSGAAHTFRYTIGAGDNDSDGITITRLNLFSGSVIRDSVGNVFALPASFSALPSVVKVDTDAPTLVISRTGEAVAQRKFIVNFAFSEDVSGFLLSEVIVTGGTKGEFSGSNTSFQAAITPSAGSSSVTIAVAANVAHDGASNGNLQAQDLVVPVDTSAPTVTLTRSDGATSVLNGPFYVDITFSESVSGFIEGDLLLSANAETKDVITVERGLIYKALIGPTSASVGNSLTLTVDMPASKVTDNGGNPNSVATQLSVTVDNKSPVTSFTAVTGTQSAAFDTAVNFDESVSGFVVGDIRVAGGSVVARAGPFPGSGTAYPITVTPTITGTVLIIVPANVANDDAGNGNLRITLEVEADALANLMAFRMAGLKGANHRSLPVDFSPIDISDLAVWLDARDSATLRLSDAPTGFGNPVGQWLDKSGRGHHYLLPSTHTAPIYRAAGDGAVVSFDAASALNRVEGSPMKGTAFVVMGQERGPQMLEKNNPLGKVSPGLEIIELNGNSRAKDSSLLRNIAGGDATEHVAEVLVYEGQLSSEQKAQVEGYLACKWQISLPTNHFYAGLCR